MLLFPIISCEVLERLVARALSSIFTPNNIGGFRKTGAFPINPRAIGDKVVSPFEAFQQQMSMSEQEASAGVQETAMNNTLVACCRVWSRSGYILQNDCTHMNSY